MSQLNLRMEPKTKMWKTEKLKSKNGYAQKLMGNCYMLSLNRRIFCQLLSPILGMRYVNVFISPFVVNCYNHRLEPMTQ